MIKYLGATAESFDDTYKCIPMYMRLHITETLRNKDKTWAEVHRALLEAEQGYMSVSSYKNTEQINRLAEIEKELQQNK